MYHPDADGVWRVARDVMAVVREWACALPSGEAEDEGENHYFFGEKPTLERDVAPA